FPFTLGEWTRRRGPIGRRQRNRLAGRAHPLDDEYGHWSGEPGHRLLTQSTGIDQLFGRQLHAVADPDLPLSGRFRELGGEMHHRPDRAVLGFTLESNRAEGRVAEIDPHPE